MIVGQKSFNSGEWAPQLHARVDLEKYRSGAALLRNFVVDYRGGASSRPGSQYVLRCFDSDEDVRLIPFQASFDVAYMLEFGDGYIRFFREGQPVLEGNNTVTNVTQANPAVVTANNIYSNGDWVYMVSVGGMTQINNQFYRIANRTPTSFSLEDLFGNPIDSTGYSPYTAGGGVAKVYTIASPYMAADLPLIKFAQNVTTMIICHPEVEPHQLQIISANNWIIAPITFGATIGPPQAPITLTSTLPSGSTNYSYVITSVDGNNQESVVSDRVDLYNSADLRQTAGTITLFWNPVDGAVSYNIYKSDVSINSVVPIGVPYGFIGNATGTSFADSNIIADFSQGPPVPRNPFQQGASVSAVTVTAPGSYTTTPGVTFTASPSGNTATGVAVMWALGYAIGAGGTGYVIGDQITFPGNVVMEVAGVTGGAVNSLIFVNNGTVTGALPVNPVASTGTDGSGSGVTVSFGWGVRAVLITDAGGGYSVTPTVTFSSGAATAVAALGTANAGNPTVPAFFQQRLCLAAPINAPQTIFMSQPGNYYNFDVTVPTQPDDAITAPLISGQLSNIKALVPQPSGLLALSDGASWLVNGGSPGAAVAPDAIAANPQSFIGCSDIPAIVANYDILYVQSKGTGVRDASYSYYSNVFTGSDISVISSHLFFGYSLREWAWAEEPFKIMWTVRNDGVMLALTFLKEQEFVAWTHCDTEEGEAAYHSVGTIVEPVTEGYANVVYYIVERTVRGQSVKYIERFVERIFPNGVEDAWCVDCGVNYSGAPISSFSGGEHLGGKTVTGLADGEIIPPFVMPTNGRFTLGAPASKVVVGLPFTCQLKTLGLELGEPTIQGKVKKIASAVVRVCDTLGLRIGSDFSRMVAMKDLIRGNVSTMLTGKENQIVTDLVTGDAKTTIDPTYTVPGQFCIDQINPYPATILGVFPGITVGNTDRD